MSLSPLVIFVLHGKRSIFCPKVKKTNLETILRNYRPISNLSFFFKLTEKAVAAQVVGHLKSHNLFPSTQSVYRKHHSSETALLKVINHIHLNMNKQHITILVLLILAQHSMPTQNPLRTVLSHRFIPAFLQSDPGSSSTNSRSMTTKLSFR